MSTEASVRDALHDTDTTLTPGFSASLRTQLEHEWDGVAEVVDLSVARSRHVRTMRWVSAVAAVVVVAITVVAVLPSNSSRTQLQTARPTNDPKLFAQQWTKQYLDGAIVPPGAKAIGIPPAPTLPIRLTGVSTTVTQEKNFALPLTTKQARDYITSHNHPDQHFNGEGISGPIHKPATDFELSWRPDPLPRPELISSAELRYAITATGETSTLLITAAAEYRVARPASEHIPARDKVVTVTATNRKPVVVTDTKEVAQLVAMFEQAYTAPIRGGVQHCPMMPVNPTVFTVSYAPAVGAAPDVVVTVNTGGCATINVTAHGKPMPALDFSPIDFRTTLHDLFSH